MSIPISSLPAIIQFAREHPTLDIYSKQFQQQINFILNPPPTDNNEETLTTILNHSKHLANNEKIWSSDITNLTDASRFIMTIPPFIGNEVIF